MKGKAEASSDPRLGPNGEQILRGLVRLRRISLHLVQRAQQGVGLLEADGLAVLASAHQLAVTDSTQALQRVETLLGGQNGE